MVVAGTMAMPAILAGPDRSYQAWNPDPVDRLGRILWAGYGKHRRRRPPRRSTRPGGVLGRELLIISEDDQTSPEAGLRAARKLIDIDKVSAIIGTWASAVTTAVVPVCSQSRRVPLTVSGAEPITLLPHQGFLIRTQPTTTLQGTSSGNSPSAPMPRQWRSSRRRRPSPSRNMLR